MKKNIILFTIILFCQNSNAQILPKINHSVTVIAHRGAHNFIPENTLKAYNKAIEIGADYIEVDLRTTKDSQLVIMHNESVDAMTNGSGNIKDLTYQDLKKLKVFNKNRTEFGYETIPSFENVLEIAKGKINIYLDFKSASVEQTWNLISKYDMQQHIVVYINQMNQLYEWKKLHPEIPLIISLPDFVRNEDSFKKISENYSFEIIDGNPQDYSPEFIKTVYKFHKQIWIDAQSPLEGPEIWSKLIKMGINTIQTDHPEALIAFLKQQHLR